MKCRGYKYSEYDATYKDATFSVVERNNGVLEIKDVESGTVFNLYVDDLMDKTNCHKGVWRAQEIQGHGTSITFGSKGWLKELKYGGKKCKMRTKGEAE